MSIYYQPVVLFNGLGIPVTVRYTLPNGIDSTVAPWHALELAGAPVGATNPIPIADTGTPATGAVAPAGATGLTGWASGIFQKLSASLAVTGTFWQATQPVSLASQPLPAGASTAALQPALNADGGALTHITNLPATQAVSLASLPALAAGGNVIGGVTISGTAAVSDPNNLAFQGAVAMTVGTSGTAGRSVGVNCTVAGNVIFTFPDASTLTVPVYVGWQTFPFAVTEVTLPGSGAATATFVNLK